MMETFRTDFFQTQVLRLNLGYGLMKKTRPMFDLRIFLRVGGLYVCKSVFKFVINFLRYVGN
jgi:hypothetical protein